MKELENIVQLVASEIFNETILGNYKFYLLIAAISLITSSIVAFFQSYMKKRGENFATKADFSEILRQLKETTSLSESIKTDLLAKLTEEQSYKILIREKLESTIEQTFELELWFENVRSAAIEGTAPDINGSPMEKIEMYQVLYFKEATAELTSLRVAFNEILRWVLELSVEAISAKNKSVGPNFNIDSFSELQKDLMGQIINFRKTLLDKYSSSAGL